MANKHDEVKTALVALSANPSINVDTGMDKMATVLTQNLMPIYIMAGVPGVLAPLLPQDPCMAYDTVGKHYYTYNGTAWSLLV
jgi:hypothetical protein